MRMNYVRNGDPDFEQMESAVWEGNRATELMIRPKSAPGVRLRTTTTSRPWLRRQR
jgi:hypothetical protein